MSITFTYCVCSLRWATVSRPTMFAGADPWGALGAIAPQTRNNVIILSSFLSYRVFCRLSCRGQILRQKCTKILFRATPDPAGETYSTPQDPLAEF